MLIALPRRVYSQALCIRSCRPLGVPEHHVITHEGMMTHHLILGSDDGLEL